MTEPLVNAELADKHGLSAEEYERLVEILGGTPSYTELGITSALWSEHCSYKSSKVYLRELPTSGERVVQGPGENAGVVDVGHGWLAVFKMESHNHPSFIEPYQGAATGVGGILRDVFTMGARPIACLDSLRFGEIEAPRMRYLVDGVVRGIGDYGNCVGIPTVGGETGFHRSYNRNILVNAFALGIARHDQLFLARAVGEGNPILYAGSRTGRDGIHGATMASESFEADSEAKRPTVQVGDPFTEKVLLEACLEAMQTGAIVGIQDMGAAGLTSSAFEMAGRENTGVEIDLDRVPLRERGLSPYEMMLSESQERMVLVAQKGREEEVVRVFEKWGLPVDTIGRVTADGRARLSFEGAVVADMPVLPLTQSAPEYRRPVEVPRDLAVRQRRPEVPEPDNPLASLEELLSSVELGSKEWIWRQYDHSVRTNTLVGPGGDAAVLRLKGTPSALALVSEVNPVYCWLDPYRGAAQAVAEAVRNLACVGAEPVGLTDCLNFGNPERPEIAWQFREAVRGMSEACRELSVPVVSGNVSFYNETEGSGIYPTPTVAVVGLIKELKETVGAYLTHAGDRVLVLGEDLGEFGGSAYLRICHQVEQGIPPNVDLRAESRLAALLRAAIDEGLVRAAHDVSVGGLAVALAEAAFGAGVGVEVEIVSSARGLFSESQARAIVAVPAERVHQLMKNAEAFGVPAVDVGFAGGDRFVLKFDSGAIDTTVTALHELWSKALPKALEG